MNYYYYTKRENPHGPYTKQMVVEDIAGLIKGILGYAGTSASVPKCPNSSPHYSCVRSIKLRGKQTELVELNGPIPTVYLSFPNKTNPVGVKPTGS